MTTGDLKKLFSEFLRLDKLIEYENTSKSCMYLMLGKKDTLMQDIEKLKTAIKDKEKCEEKLNIAMAEKRVAENDLAELKEELKSAETKMAFLQEAIAKNEFARAKLKDMEKFSDRILKEIRNDKEQSEMELSMLRSRVIDIKSEIAGIESLLANELEIRAAAERIELLTTQIKNISKQGESAWDDYFTATQEIGKKDKEIHKANLAVTEYDRKSRYEINEIKNHIAQCKEKMSDLDKKDPACRSATCSFIVGALEAQRQLPELEKKLDDLQSETAKKKAEYERIAGKINAEFEALKKEEAAKKKVYDELTARKFRLEDNADKLKPLAEQIVKIETASSKKADLEKRKQELTNEGVRVRNIWIKRISDKQAEHQAIAENIKRVQNNIDDNAGNKFTACEKAISSLKTKIGNMESGLLPSLEAGIRGLKNIIESIAHAEKDLEAMNAKMSAINSEISEWKYLKNACSKDGLRALEIDSVAPVISGYANDLLMSTFGPLYTVKFRTQDEETGREILDIVVIRDDGTEVLLDDLSGGEKVWSLKALRLAMTLIAKEKSGKNFLCALADEEDGALDVDNAQNFVNLYRSFMHEGGFQDCFYISHKPECVAMADHIVKFNSGGVTIE